MQHQASIKLLSLAMVAVMAMTCFIVMTSDDESDAVTDLGSWRPTDDPDRSSPDAAYSSIANNVDKIYNSGARTLYLLQGGNVSLSEWGETKTFYIGSIPGGAGFVRTDNGDGTSIVHAENIQKLGSLRFLLSEDKDGQVNDWWLEIIVVADTTPVTSVSISGSTSGEVGDSITLTASTSPSSADNRHVTWSITSGSSYASIRSQTDTTTGGRCVIDLDRAGTVTVRATADDGSGEYDTHRITITEPEVLVTSVSISGSTSVNIGSSITLRATTSPSDADDRHVNWSITSGSNRVSYTVSDTSTGGTITLTGLSAGSVTVRATAADGSGEYDTHTVTVVQPVVNITTSQGDVTIIAGQEFSLNVSTNVSGCTIGVSGADWLSVSGSTVSGTPNSSGEFDITITASRSGYTSDSISFTITVVSALGFTNEPSNGVTVYVVS